MQSMIKCVYKTTTRYWNGFCLGKKIQKMLFYIFYYREIILKSWLKKVRLKRSEPKNTKKCFENEMSVESLKSSDMEI